MEIFFSLQKLPLLVAGILLVLALAIHTKLANGKILKHAKRWAPEPSGSWPIIGHLHLLAGSDQLMHRTLADMADKLGPVFSIRLGTHRALVVSNKSAARECFTTNDRVFPGRPQSIAGTIMGYDNKMFGLAPYGHYWRDMRKLATVELLSNRGLELVKHVRITEVNRFIGELHRESAKNVDAGRVEVDMKERFGDLTTNIIVRMVAGKRLLGAGSKGKEGEERRWQKALGDFMYLMGLFMVSDAVPFLGWLDWVRGYVGEMKKTARELDGILGNWVKEHREERGGEAHQDKDFVHVLLSALDDSNSHGSDHQTTDAIIKATCFALILGGNEPTMTTITWALSLLLNNKSALERAQGELDLQVGSDRLVQESDIKNLVYLQAIVKETLRLYPAAPLSVPRIALEDCTVAGFHIPAGTRLFINLWKLHRDPEFWSEPLEFRPERFLEGQSRLDVRGQDFEYLPFGSGRRMCPGVSFSLQVVQLVLAQLLHGFEIRTRSDWSVDMTEGPGLTMPKAGPLEVVLKPRLPAALYEF